MTSAVRALGRPLRRRISGIDRVLVRAETRSALRHQPVIVFSMGKTGTTALTNALAERADRPVLKAHALSRAGIDERLAKAARLRVVDRPRFLWACEVIAEELTGGRGRWDLLCGVRDPIAFAVSDHFYGIQRQFELGVDTHLCTDDIEFHARAVEAVLRTRVLDVDWFDTELRAITGVDVYASSFPTAEGHAVVANERFRALVIRAEDLPRVGPSALAEFLSLPRVPELSRRNEGTAADPDSLYHRFLRAAPLPPHLVEEVYATRLARHFYDDGERAAFADRWLGVAA